MMSTSFKEQIKKNDLLDVYSNIMDIVYLNILDGEKEISVNVAKDSYCLLYIKCGAITSKMDFMLNGISITTIKNSGDTCIPLKLKYGDKISIDGSANGVFIGLTGGKFIRKMQDRILPLNGQYVTFGKNATLYNISALSDIFSDSLSSGDMYENCYFIQTYINNNMHYVGKVHFDNGVYFSTSMDNYAIKYKILDDVPEDIIFLQDVSAGNMQFLYILDGYVYSKTYDSDITLLLEGRLLSAQGKVARCLVASESYVASPKIYAIVYDDSIDIMYLKNYANTQKIAELSGKYIKIIEESESARYLIYKDYNIENICADINSQEMAGNIVSISSIENIDNVIDGYIFDDEMKVVSTGLDVCNIDI